MSTGTQHLKRWTSADERRILAGWGHVPLKEIATAIGRTPLAVYVRATQTMRLGAPIPQGFEGLTDAANRLGVTTHQLRAMNALVGNSRYIVRAIVRPFPRARTPSRWMIEAGKADRILRAWLELETPEVAARRYGFSSTVVRDRLRRAAEHGVEGIPPNPPGNSHWRIPRSILDEIMMRWVNGETLVVAAARLGTSASTLRRALNRRGIGVERGWPMLPDEYDAALGIAPPVFVELLMMHDVLQAIADGHPDPRTLAKAADRQ